MVEKQASSVSGETQPVAVVRNRNSSSGPLPHPIIRTPFAEIETGNRVRDRTTLNKANSDWPPIMRDIVDSGRRQKAGNLFLVFESIVSRKE
jgi:hypothetical protein